MKRSAVKNSFFPLIFAGLLFTGVGASSGADKETSPTAAASATSLENSKEEKKESDKKADEQANAGKETSKETKEEVTANDASNPDACLVDQTALEDLKKRRAELEKKNKELVERENELKSRERAVEEQIKKMEEVRDQITQGDNLKKKENQEKIAKIVETIESMSPKAAALLIASIDEPLAIAAITQVSTPKLAKMMNIMEPARAFRLTELLAGVTRAKRPTSPVVKIDVAAVTKAEKGGEIDNANNTESKTNTKGSSSGEKSREPASNAGREKPGK